MEIIIINFYILNNEKILLYNFNMGFKITFEYI